MSMNHYSVITGYNQEFTGYRMAMFPVQHPVEVWAKDQAHAAYLYAYHGIAYLYMDVTVDEVDASDLGGALGALCNGFYPELN